MAASVFRHSCFPLTLTYPRAGPARQVGHRLGGLVFAFALALPFPPRVHDKIVR
jgi:hypothetical protein